MTQPAIPVSAEALTAAWLTQALRSTGTLTNATVVDFTADRLGEAEGLMSRLVRLRLRYDVVAAGAPPSLIAKFPTEAIDRFVVARLLGLYEREAGFYAELRDRVPLRTPRCYFQARDPANDGFVLLLEDLAPARPGDQVAGCPAAWLAVAVEQAADLHAAWWEHPQLGALPWMPSWDNPLVVSFFAEAYQRAWQQYRRSLPAWFPEKLAANGDRLGAAIRLLLEHLSRPPGTLLHGDYRVDNFLFDPLAPGGRPAVIDWQLCARGRGVADVAYLLSQSVEPEVRRAEEMRLLDRYHRLLVDHGVRGYSFADCLLDYRRAVLLGLVYPIVAAQTLARIQARGRELATVMIRRSTAAVLDLNADELLP